MHKKHPVWFIGWNEKGLMVELKWNVQMRSVERKMAGRKERSWWKEGGAVKQTEFKINGMARTARKRTKTSVSLSEMWSWSVSFLLYWHFNDSIDFTCLLENSNLFYIFSHHIFITRHISEIREWYSRTYHRELNEFQRCFV